MTHRIQQQHLQVTLHGTEAEGLALQSRLSGLCNDWLSPALERVLDRLAPPDAHLYIERLEIDAGTLSLDRLEHELAAAVASAVEKAIKEQVIPGEAGQASIPSYAENIQYKSEQQTILNAFLYFLETGRLPWSFRLPTGATLESLVSAQSFNRRELLRIQQNIGTTSVQERLLNQFSTDFLQYLLAQLSPEGAIVFQQIINKLQASDIRVADLQHIEKKLTETLLAKVAKEESINENQLVRLLIQSSSHNTPSSQQPKWVEIVQQLWKDGDLNLLTPAAQPKKRNPKSTNTPNKTASTLSLPPENVRPSTIEETEGIYIDNAGLVLLHPFLPMFFEATGIAQQNELLQPERALGLLHFLATGQTIAPEYELVLPKILCNLPLETPVESASELTASEKEESEALLAAVIRHWDALRDTSPDGLRGTFLCRAGKISRRDERDWLLQVERKSYDILLDQLPWGISMIQLPWMEGMLWVEWN